MNVKILIIRDKILAAIKVIVIFFFLLHMLTASGKRTDALYDLNGKDNFTEEITLYYYDYFPFNAEYHPVKATECSKYSEKTSAKNSGILRCRQYVKVLRSHGIVKKWKVEEREKGYIAFMADASGNAAIHANILSIKPLNLSGYSALKNTNRVTGIFKRYALNVKQYAFKNVRTGKVTRINATPNHPFYVLNKKKFIPVSQISPVDTLLSDKRQRIHMLCHKKQSCGVTLNKGYPTLVYNLEVHGGHTYFISAEDILVHNNCYVHLHNYLLTDEERAPLPTGYNIASHKLSIFSAEEILVQAGSAHSVDKTLFSIIHGALDINDQYPLMIYGDEPSVNELVEMVCKTRNEYLDYESICVIHCAPEELDVHREYFQALADAINKPVIYNAKGKITQKKFCLRRAYDAHKNLEDAFERLGAHRHYEVFINQSIVSNAEAAQRSELEELSIVEPTEFFRTVYPGHGNPGR